VSDDGDDGYVHEPGGDDAGPPDRGTPTDGTGARQPRNTPDPEGAEFDWGGWLLVAAVVFAFLVVPGALYLLPTVQDAVASLGLGLRHTYLVLPLLPAFLLGAIAVWSAVRSRSGE
jgi:hypothetical protein